MNTKIISLILIGMISSTALISCGSSNSASTSTSASTTSSDTSSTEEDKPIQNSKISENPTVDVNSVASISDFKGKGPDDIKSVLGNPVSENNNVSSYEKDGYKFDITYYDSICGQIKITPDTTMKFPTDATISLKVVGITAGDSDEFSPAALVWNNQYDTYSIKVVPDDSSSEKIGSIQIILDEKYK